VYIRRANRAQGRLRGVSWPSIPLKAKTQVRLLCLNERVSERIGRTEPCYKQSKSTKANERASSQRPKVTQCHVMCQEHEVSPEACAGAVSLSPEAPWGMCRNKDKSKSK
jgi:hypothetical protein